jgi:hypothetical protein
MTTAIKGPGLLYVNSKLASNLLDEETYLKWYSEDHIPEVIATSGIDSALRFKDIDSSADKEKSSRKLKCIVIFCPKESQFMIWRNWMLGIMGWRKCSIRRKQDQVSAYIGHFLDYCLALMNTRSNEVDLSRRYGARFQSDI